MKEEDIIKIKRRFFQEIYIGRVKNVIFIIRGELANIFSDPQYMGNHILDRGIVAIQTIDRFQRGYNKYLPRITESLRQYNNKIPDSKFQEKALISDIWTEIFPDLLQRLKEIKKIIERLIMTKKELDAIKMDEDYEKYVTIMKRLNYFYNGGKSQIGSILALINRFQENRAKLKSLSKVYFADDELDSIDRFEEMVRAL